MGIGDAKMFTRVTRAVLLIGAIATSTAAAATDEWQIKTSPHSVALSSPPEHEGSKR